jgi:hypothetical protein
VEKVGVKFDSLNKMALITKMLQIAVDDCEAGRITREHLILIFQEAIDNGDILEEANELCVLTLVLPLIDTGVLHSSENMAMFEARTNARILDFAQELRREKQREN